MVSKTVLGLTFAAFAVFCSALAAGGVGSAGPVRCGCGNSLPCSSCVPPRRPDPPEPRRNTNPGDGYTWTTNHPNDLRVRRRPRAGTVYQGNPKLVWTEDGRVTPISGYRLVNPDNPRDLRVERIPAGTAHAVFPHVVWKADGTLRPADGYVWDSSQAREKAVIRVISISETTLKYESMRVMLRDQEAMAARAKAFSMEGKKLFLQNNLEKALVEYEKAVSISPPSGRKWGIEKNMKQIRQKLEKRKLTGQSRETRNLIASDSLVRITVPSPVLLNRKYRAPAVFLRDWSSVDADPVVALGSQGIQKLAGYFKSKAEEAGYELTVKTIPGARLIKSSKDKWDEMTEMITEPRLKTFGYVLWAIERGVERLGDIYDDGSFADQVNRDVIGDIEEQEEFYTKLFRKKAKGWFLGGS